LQPSHAAPDACVWWQTKAGTTHLWCAQAILDTRRAAGGQALLASLTRSSPGGLYRVAGRAVAAWRGSTFLSRLRQLPTFVPRIGHKGPPASPPLPRQTPPLLGGESRAMHRRGTSEGMEERGMRQEAEATQRAAHCSHPTTSHLPLSTCVALLPLVNVNSLFSFQRSTNPARQPSCLPERGPSAGDFPSCQSKRGRGIRNGDGTHHHNPPCEKPVVGEREFQRL